MADTKGTSYSTDPALYLYTSLTAGSSHIVTATSRLETILRANRVPFKAIDIATDEKARMLWGRRAGKDEGGRVRKLPGLVQMGLVLGDLVEIEEWNEYGELKQHVTIYYDDFTIPSKSQAPPPIVPKAKPVAPPAAPAAPAGAASTAASSAPKPPSAPALPKASELSAQKSKLSSAPPSAAAKPTLSIAEEAAKKAKQVHLDSLRAKVYGKKDGSGASTGSKESLSRSSTDSARESMNNLSLKDKDKAKDKEAGKEKAKGEAGLQSPTTGTWKGGVPAEDNLRQVLQSPTTGTWKEGGKTEEFQGAVVENASKAEIAAVEKAEAIPEATSSEEEEEEEEEDSSEEESEEEDEKKVVVKETKKEVAVPKKETKKKESEDDDDDDDDEDDDDDDDEEESSEEEEEEEVPQQNEKSKAKKQ